MVGGPIARILAQAAVMASTVLARSFMQAYQQAAQQAKTGAKQQAKTGGAKFKSLKKQMERDQALQILNFDKSQPPKSMNEVMERYNRYFEANAVQKGGGSFYLQSKIFRAKETLEKSFEEKTDKKSK